MDRSDEGVNWRDMISAWDKCYFLKTWGLTSLCLISAFHNCRQDSGEPWDLETVRGGTIGEGRKAHLVSLHNDEATLNVAINKILYGHPPLKSDLTPIHTANP